MYVHSTDSRNYLEKRTGNENINIKIASGVELNTTGSIWSVFTAQTRMSSLEYEKNQIKMIV